jgi:hypothetical protein
MNAPNRKLNHYCSSIFLKLISHQLNLVTMLALCLLPSYCTLLVAADKPLLSEAIAKGTDNHGVAATAEMFAQSFENDKDAYTVDMDGVANLGKKYMKATCYTVPLWPIGDMV